MKHPVLKTRNYILFFEYVILDGFKEVIVAHADVYKWNKKIKKELIDNFFLMFRVQELPIYAIVDKTDTKLAKFSNMNGFYLFKEDVTIKNGETKNMYKWIGSK